MRISGWLSALWLATGCAVRGPDLSEKGMVPAMATSDALTAALEPRRRAILIGIDGYRDPAFPDLEHAGHDAESFAEILSAERGGGFDEVVLLTGEEETTRAAIVRALQEARSELRREDELVVYFSGHGTRVPDGNRRVRFLLAGDSKPGDLEGTALELAAIQEFFGLLSPARKLFVVDACFHGDGKSVVRPDPLDGAVIEGPDSLVPRATAMGPAEAHLFATTSGRPSLESDELEHGVYTYFLLEALSWGLADADLDDDGVVTAYEAHDHARGRTIAFTEGVQVPEAAFRLVGEGDMVLAGDPAARRRSTALLYLYAGDSRFDDVSVVIDGRTRGTLPGTVSIRGGRHRVTLEDDEGVLLDGHVTLRAGQSYRVEDVVRIARGPSGGLALRPSVVHSAPLGQAIGGGAGGLEIGGVWRRNTAPARGLTGEVFAGLATSPSREIDGVITDAGRGLGWLGGAVAYQTDLRRVRLRGGWGLSGVLIPPSYVDEPPAQTVDPYAVPAEAGWILFASGPQATLGYVVSETWTLAAHGRSHVALLDIDGDGDVTGVPWLTWSVGAELAW